MRNDPKGRVRLNRVRPRVRAGGGFTLVELLVVIVIILLVSAVTLPGIVSAYQNRQVSEGARVLQAAIAGSQNEAIRANAPRGFRLFPDSALGGGTVLTASRMIAIEPAPDITDGLVTFPSTSAGATTGLAWSGGVSPRYPLPISSSGGGGGGFYPWPVGPAYAGGPNVGCLMIMQSVYTTSVVAPGAAYIPASPTNWFWNVRVGDRIRLNNSGRYYTVIGPMTVSNPELFVNDGQPGALTTLLATYPGDANSPLRPEFLFLVNGDDDNNNGYIDEGVDGIDNDLNGSIDDIYEWNGTNYASTFIPEVEAWVGSQVLQAGQPTPPVVQYSIARRPVPTQGAREFALPPAAVIDLTTWNTTRERSRLPVNPFNHTVDVLIDQAGQVVTSTSYSTPSSNSMANAFYHFWVADRMDVTEAVGTSYPSLPVPQNTPNTPSSAVLTNFLRRDRRLVTLFAKTGQVVTNSIENIDWTDPIAPYRDAQLGIREAK